MPRKPVILQSECPYHVTARSNNQDWFQIPLDFAWILFQEKIETTAERYGFETHAFVLMSNHFHWIVSTPKANLSQGMRYFMTETSRALARAARRTNRIYGSRYRWTLIDSPAYYACALRYVYQNPLRAGLSATCETYRFSSLSATYRLPLLPTAYQVLVPPSATDFIPWLNELPDAKEVERTRRALRRTRFTPPRRVPSLASESWTPGQQKVDRHPDDLLPPGRWPLAGWVNDDVILRFTR